MLSSNTLRVRWRASRWRLRMDYSYDSDFADINVRRTTVGNTRTVDNPTMSTTFLPDIDLLSFGVADEAGGNYVI